MNQQDLGPSAVEVENKMKTNKKVKILACRLGMGPHERKQAQGKDELEMLR